MSFGSLARDFIDWIFFENETFFKAKHKSFMQKIIFKYSRRFYQELALALIDRINVFYETQLQHKNQFDHRTNHQVMMLISLLPYCDFDKLDIIHIPVWVKSESRWTLQPYTLKFLALDKFIFKDPKRVLLLCPTDQEYGYDYHIVFMGTHPLPTSPGWQMGICADSNPFLNFGELILRVFKKEILEVVDLITQAKQSSLICVGHSLGGALSLLLFQLRPGQIQVYALNPPRFINPPAQIKNHNDRCVIYVQKGDLLQQVGMQWPAWSQVITLDLDRKLHKVRPFMAHCRSFSAAPDCTISISRGDPLKSRFNMVMRYATTTLWQLLSLPFFLLQSCLLLLTSLSRQVFRKKQAKKLGD